MSGGVKILEKFFRGSDLIYRINEPMKNHASAKVGGPAAAMLLPRSADEIIPAVVYCRENDVPYFIIGNGTNLIVRDEGCDGLIIKIAGGMSGIERFDNDSLSVAAGAPLNALCDFAMEAGLSGLEFASGIPGAVGGAVCMNAGAYGGEIKDALVSASVIVPDADGGPKILTLTADELDFGYRESAVGKKNLIVLGAVFKLISGDREKIAARMDELNEKRRRSQPLDMPSAGSAFKRPKGHYAGKLISGAGLSGCSVGGAMVSEKHCGFIVNTGGATARDFLDLIALIRATVAEKYGVELVPEPRIL